jgi:hypothetical protein
MAKQAGHVQMQLAAAVVTAIVQLCGNRIAAISGLWTDID